MSHSWISQLSSLLGLDDETVSTQIWPQVASLNSRPEILDYLHTLIGAGPAQQSFIQSYIESKFPSPKAPAPRPTSSTPWGKASPSASSSTARGSTSVLPPTRTPVSAADRSALERAFGGGGKVYVKNRDEEFGSGMGGKGKKNKSGTATPMLPAPVVAPPPAVKQIVPPPPVLPSPAQMQSSASSLQKKEKSPVTTGSGGRNTNGNGNSSEELVEISDEAAKALLEIESAVASLSSKVKGKSVVRECFCAARQHPLSLFTPLCLSCGLVICIINSSNSPCPSCSFHPLISPQALSTQLSALQSRRETILSNEAARVQRRKEEEERERRALRFPTLGGGSGDGGAKLVTQPRGYASMAGAGPGLEERITRAYETGISLNGKPFGKPVSGGESKVLRLDMKTKKVKIVVKVSTQGKSKETVKEKVIEDAFEDGYTAWIDENDDGFRVRKMTKDPEVVPPSLKAGVAFKGDLFKSILHPTDRQKLQHKLSALSNARLDSPFANPSRPVSWVEEVHEEKEDSEDQPVASVHSGKKLFVPGMAVAAPAKKRRGKGMKKSGSSATGASTGSVAGGGDVGVEP